MASASVVYPDEVLLTTSGKSYFTRLTRLLICGGTKVLRELFDSMNPSTHAFLKTKTVNCGLHKMKKNRVLTRPQWKTLFPTKTTCGKSTDFDITLIFKLLREFCSLTAPAKGWDELPDDRDLTLPADLARIKYYRNDVYAHVSDKMELSDTDFQDLWIRIKDALLRIVKHYDPSAVLGWEEAIEKLLTDPLSEEAREYEEELEEWYLQDQDVKKMISNTTEDIRKDIRDLKAQLNPSSPDFAEEAEAEAAPTTPPEILARTPEALKAYKEALIRGKTKNQRVLVTIVGPSRAGKTSLLKSLKGEKFDPEEDSTTGVVLQKAFCKPQEDSWFEEDNGKDDLSKKSICEFMAQKLENHNQTRDDKTITETTATNYQAVMAVAERPPSQKDLEYEEHKAGESVKEIDFSFKENTGLQQSDIDEISQVPKEIRDSFVNHMTDIKKTGQRTSENDISLKTLDFAGQQVYEVILPLFMSSKSIYVLVHNLENDLLSDAQPKVKHDNSERQLDNPYQMTHLNAQEFWLSCISSYTKNEVYSGGRIIQVALPPVFVVCTHADVCKQDPKKVARELCKILKRPENSYGKHVVPNVYTVDNTISGNKEIKDESAKRLKRDVEELSKLLPQVDEDIPVSWLRFEKELSKLVEKEQKKYVDLEEAMRIATKCNVNTATGSIEFITLLNYLHDLKTIIHFEETRTVFIDTQWLVNMFVKVITVMPFEEWKEYADYWRKLEDEGILQRALVDHVWSDMVSDGQNTVDSLLLIMEKFSLICPWKLDEEEVYLVPCMLCNSKRTEDIEMLLADQKSSTMVMRFKSVHLPMGIFPRLFVALAEYGKKEWPKVRLNLRPNFCRMYNVEREGRLDLCITSGIRTICVTVYNKNNIDGPSVTKFCQSVRKLLDEIFGTMQHTCPRVENLELEYGIRCPVCTKSKMKCSSHKNEGCKRDSCLHFVGEEELKLDRPECYEDETNPDTLIRKETYSHWFPKTNKRVQVETHPLETNNHGNEASGNAGCQELVAFAIINDLATISSNTAADKVAEYLQLDKSSMADPPADIQQKCRGFCQQLKKMRRHDIIKELRKTLPSGMTGPLLDDDTLYQELEYKTRRDLTRALCGNDVWKRMASVLGVSGNHIGYFERQLNPAESMLEDDINRSLKVVELYDLLVQCDAGALADNYL